MWNQQGKVGSWGGVPRYKHPERKHLSLERGTTLLLAFRGAVSPTLPTPLQLAWPFLGLLPRDRALAMAGCGQQIFLCQYQPCPPPHPHGGGPLVT